MADVQVRLMQSSDCRGVATLNTALGEGVGMREVESYTERGLEFVEMISDKLPMDGSHVIGGVRGGRGLIIRSREAPEEDLDAMREALATGRANDLAFATADVLKGRFPEFISAVRLPAFWVLGQYLDAGIVRPKLTSEAVF